MTITARFASRCAACGGPIKAGTQIEWSKGSAARHTTCTTSTSPRRAQSGRPYGQRKRGVVYSSAPAKSRRLREAAEGEQIIHRSSRDFVIGETVQPRGLEGYWTVVAESSHRISEWEDDTREGETRYDAIVRPATEAETEVAAARKAAADAKKAAVAEIVAVRQAVCCGANATEHMHVPDATDVGARVGKIPGCLWSGLAGSSTLLISGDTLVAHESSYDDLPRTWAVTDAALAKRLRLAMDTIGGAR